MLQQQLPRDANFKQPSLTLNAAIVGNRLRRSGRRTNEHASVASM